LEFYEIYLVPKEEYLNDVDIDNSWLTAQNQKNRNPNATNAFLKKY
jgi:hypothetical protein